VQAALDAIDETDRAIRGEILDRCWGDSDALAYWVSRAHASSAEAQARYPTATVEPADDRAEGGA
jgi:hypothetical protein